MKQCVDCGASSKPSFSKEQWKKGEGMMKCKVCLQAAKVKAKPPLIIKCPECGSTDHSACEKVEEESPPEEDIAPAKPKIGRLLEGDIHSAIRDNDQRLFNECISIGQLALRSAEGNMPLHTACLANNYMLSVTLINKGADVNERTVPDGDTSLHLAVRNKCDVNLVEMLIGLGADRSAANSRGEVVADIMASQDRFSNVEVMTPSSFSCTDFDPFVPTLPPVDPLDILSPEVMYLILARLDGQSLSHALMVSKTWAAQAKDEMLWRTLCRLAHIKVQHGESYREAIMDIKRRKYAEYLREELMARFNECAVVTQHIRNCNAGEELVTSLPLTRESGGILRTERLTWRKARMATSSRSVCSVGHYDHHNSERGCAFRSAFGHSSLNHPPPSCYLEHMRIQGTLCGNQGRCHLRETTRPGNPPIGTCNRFRFPCPEHARYDYVRTVLREDGDGCPALECGVGRDEPDVLLPRGKFCRYIFQLPDSKEVYVCNVGFFVAMKDPKQELFSGKSPCKTFRVKLDESGKRALM